MPKDTGCSLPAQRMLGAVPMPKDTGCCPNTTPSWKACETASPDDARGEWSADSGHFDELSSDPGIVQQDERRQPSSPDALSSD